MSSSGSMTTNMDDIFMQIGGLGRFQIFAIVSLKCQMFPVAWSMLQMSFSGIVPDWYCEAPNNRSIPLNQTLNECSYNVSMELTTNCEDFRFLGSAVTIVSEWNLVCDMAYVKKLITSVQMAGVFVGAFSSGQIGEAFGRKGTNCGYFLFLAIVNVVTGFSVGWEMFIVGRFLIGAACGGVLVVHFSYLMEFLPTRWRAIATAMPFWAIGTAIYALACYLLEHWAHLQWACAAISVPSLLTFFIMPETPRWLTVKGRIPEAEAAIAKIASLNGKPVPKETRHVLESIYKADEVRQSSGKVYSYLDLFRSWQMAKTVFIFSFLWCTMSIIYYGMSFGVSALSGNVYLNIFLMSLMDIPGIMSTYYLSNRIGRKWTTFLYLVMGLAASLSCLVVHFTAPGSVRGDWITGLSLVSKLSFSTAWAVILTWGTELFPTVVRNLGAGITNTAARIGGIIAPYTIDLDLVVISYVTMAILSLIDIILILIVPETKDQDLEDTFSDQTTVKNGKNDKQTKNEKNKF